MRGMYMVCNCCSYWSLVQSNHSLQRQWSHHPVKLLIMPLKCFLLSWVF